MRDAALELFLLVGADNDELLAGVLGRRAQLNRFPSFEHVEEGIDSDMVRCFCRGMSKYPIPLSGAVVGRRLEHKERALEWFLLLELEDLREDRRSGMITTGITSCVRGGRLEVKLAGRDMSDATLHRS